MIDDLNKLDCNEARESIEMTWSESNPDAVAFLRHFINQVEALQRKYTKPIAALLKKDANG